MVDHQQVGGDLDLVGMGGAAGHREALHDTRSGRVAHVDDAGAGGPHVADEQVIAVTDELAGIAVAVQISVADQAQVLALRAAAPGGDLAHGRHAQLTERRAVVRRPLPPASTVISAHCGRARVSCR